MLDGAARLLAIDVGALTPKPRGVLQVPRSSSAVARARVLAPRSAWAANDFLMNLAPFRH